ncbi:hypothetical protein PCASD_08112 [Puccinia coronata f. sp. avenae]|uniref:Uncharacterized protein n=1 Tax=Puccinia coronata f. sp. avenae TaxID=200324 RepID=A0A2N5VAB9_9BASI|nr:hypothetical protein PCASD_08112 [Puccinia coronata f. sp. avenae]
MKKKVWATVGPAKPFPIELQVALPAKATGFKELIEIVASACKKKVANTGAIIRKSINCESLDNQIEWGASIPCIDSFKKTDNFVISNQVDFQSWMDTLVDVGGTEAVLSLEMPNPKHKAAWIHQAQLLAKVALWEELARANKQKSKEPIKGFMPNDSDVKVEEEDDTDNIKLCMRNIYREHPSNVLYDSHMPVYIHLTQENQYILLSHDACQEWAQALLLPTNVVTYSSLPKSLKFKKLSSKKRKSPPDNAKLREALNSYFQSCSMAVPARGHGSSDYQSNSDSSFSSTPKDENSCIKDYLKFIGLKDQLKVAQILSDADIHSHKQFKSNNLDWNELNKLGLTIGVVAQLVNNVGKYDCPLAKSKLP